MQNTPPVMRTGLLGAPTQKIDKCSPLGKRLISLIFVLVNRSAITAAEYCAHAKRTVVTKKDIGMALRFHAKHFLNEDGMEKLHDEANSMEDLVSQFVSEELSTEDVVDTMIDAEDDEAEDAEDDETDENSVCQCGSCTDIRNVEWDEWNPTDPAEQFLKNHIDAVFCL